MKTGTGPRVVVTGATGAVGPSLVRRLVTEGASVVAVARNRPSPGLLPPAIVFETADLSGAGAAAIVRGADVVFHLAARLHVKTPGVDLRAERAEYERLNVEMTRRLVDATSPGSRFVQFSTIDVYGPTPAGECFDETTPARPRSFYGETKLLAEEAVRAHPGHVVLRLAAVYGPLVKANYARLVTAVRRGWYVQVGAGRNRRTLVYEDDAAEAAWLSASDSRSMGAVYNVTDGRLHAVADIVGAIASALGTRAPAWRLPVAPVRCAAVVAERLFGAVGRRPPITAHAVEKLQEEVAVAGERIMRELHFAPRFDLEAGWRTALAASGAGRPGAGRQ